MNVTTSECDIMKCLWDAKRELTIKEMVELLHEKFQRNWAYNTVGTFLTLLEKKGYVKRFKQKRQFYYLPTIEFEQFKKEYLEETASYWYDGSVFEMIAGCVSSQPLSEQEKEKIKEILEKRN